MKVVHTIKDLQAELAVLRAQGKKVGLVLQLAKCIRNRIPVNLAMHHWIR